MAILILSDERMRNIVKFLKRGGHDFLAEDVENQINNPVKHESDLTGQQWQTVRSCLNTLDGLIETVFPTLNDPEWDELVERIQFLANRSNS